MKLKMSLLSVFGLVVVLSLGVSASAEEAAGVPTFTKDVAPIFFDNCVSCHRIGEFAPMSLMTYDEARPWARAIKQRVEAREMPPWYAEPGHQTYINDASLSDDEVHTIAAWVDGGAPRGDIADLPVAPEFAADWTIGEPDAVYSMLEAFEVPADGTVPYVYFTIPTNLADDKWIKAVEIRPGDRRVVHHVIATMQSPDPEFPPSPEPRLTLSPSGRGGAGGARSVLGGKSLAGTVPNKFGETFHDGVAMKMAAGTEIVFQIHYTTIGELASDRTSVGLIFQDEEPTWEAGGGIVVNPRFAIPAGAENHEVRAARELKEDTYLTGMTPHMHSRGKAFSYTAIYPDGSEEILLNVPEYTFDWQLTYEFAEPKLLPAGTKLVGVAHFDNSVNNRANPDPTAEVRWGDQTWEEMMIGFYGTVSAEDMNKRTTTQNQQ